MPIISVKPTGNLQLDLSKSIIPGRALRALFLLQEPYIQDTVTSVGHSATSATFRNDSPGLVLAYSGAQSERLIDLSLTSDTNWSNWVAMGKFKPSANASSVIGYFFGTGNSGGAGCLGIGNDASGNVGGMVATSSGRQAGARSAGTNGNLYTVYSSGGAFGSNKAWINGAPATTQSVAISGNELAFNEFGFGARYTSGASPLGFAQGALEWGALIYGVTMTDGLAQALYNSDWPYCMLVPAIRPRRTQRLVTAPVSSGFVPVLGGPFTGGKTIPLFSGPFA